jgi:hypothetical protein
MDATKFSRIAESLRQYRRAELKDFEPEISGGDPVDTLYVDPLHGDAVLNTMLSSSTTFISGRKGTGKSTVFAKGQSRMRERKDLLSVYVDVKALYDTVNASEVPLSDVQDLQISADLYRSHMLRKSFLAAVISELVTEIKKAGENMSLWDRWTGRQWDYNQLVEKLSALAVDVKKARLSDEEVPILRRISEKTRTRRSAERTSTDSNRGEMKLSPNDASLGLSTQIDDIDKTLSDNEIFGEYSDVILRSFPFMSLLEDIKNLLDEAGIKRLVVFFDDFSELDWIDQKLFVDVVLAPLNNTSDERVKLKVACYPGRIYYGKIDPGKIDTVNLDFSQLYEAQDIQSAENAAIDYTKRLLQKRFEAFGENISEYFDSRVPLDDFMRLLFETTFNVPRLIGYILHYCYLDQISKGQPITEKAIRLAAKKHYDSVVSQYFNRVQRFALEPSARKLDRHNQHELLKTLIGEAKEVRRRISTGTVGGTYFQGLTNPPVSHFAVSPKLEKVLSSLELNFLVTKYHDMRDKDGNDVSIYAFLYGLCESERLPWGYPRGRRDDRSYFVQRSFNYTSVVYSFLAKSQTIRCADCGGSFSIEERDKFEFFGWSCPQCKVGKCSIVVLGKEFEAEVQALNEDLMLEPVELEILDVLNDEARRMRAKEISALINTTYQMVGKRTTKLQQMDLVHKDDVDGDMKSEITEKAKSVYFDPDLEEMQ